MTKTSRPQLTAAEIEAADPALFSEPRVVRFQDVDAAGIVFHPRVLEYFHDAYTSLLARGGFDVPAIIRSGELALPIVHAEADYARPLRYGDAVRVEVAVAVVGERSYTLGHRILGPEGRLAATGRTVHVCVDPRSFASCPVPEALRRVLGAPPGSKIGD